ncbi:ABC transporter substrate-binding protein [Teredinibacter sp. KSP-S5-2]|uniref:ABC transporter substrate-binding protein n=1 Tax=Teredinibacter sp. KSP-S5-2 TaxID=3034506 RepID=UPI00293459D1|nr:ABC transporter substrate-binding protein [Teredinibacter sp. KSP-S5-2]WNO09438.1 ABC transporter substrate-binding protein [Teredinibacter sp. KSP-S5-2]
MRKPWIYIAAIVLTLLSIFTGCSKRSEKVITIGINPWPGYELLYLAGVKGFYQEVGLNVRLEELSSLSDTMRAFTAGRVDGFTSTIVEAVQLKMQPGRQAQIVLAADYSDGGDVIISRKEIPDIASLKGKRVGCEVMGLGLFVLDRALAKSGMSISDVKVVNAELLRGQQLLDKQEIDAFVGYPPESIKLIQNPDYHVIFSSSETPKEIIDVVSISEKVLQENPEFVEKLHQVWQRAYSYTLEYPEQAYTIMAERERISVEDFKRTFEEDLYLLSSDESKEILGNPEEIISSAASICSALKDLRRFVGECQSFEDLIYRIDNG